VVPAKPHPANRHFFPAAFNFARRARLAATTRWRIVRLTALTS
jgi:hypothetical protein